MTAQDKKTEDLKILEQLTRIFDKPYEQRTQKDRQELEMLLDRIDKFSEPHPQTKSIRELIKEYEKSEISSNQKA